MQRRLIYFAPGVVLVIAGAIGHSVIKHPSALPATSAASPNGPAAKAGQLPDPSILVLDRAAIMRTSNVGQDVSRQIQAYAAKAKSEIDRQRQKLQNDVQQMQQKLASLAPDAKRKRVEVFETRRAALREAAQRKDEQLKATFAKARKVMEEALSPILQQVTHERGANMVLDKQVVPLGDSSAFDITGEVIKRLNEKLPSYKVVLAPAK